MSRTLAAAITLGLALLVGSFALPSATAGTVEIHWPSPSSADVLRDPVVVEVRDTRSWMAQKSVGGGLKPGYDGREHPYDAPPREDWSLSAPNSFPSGVRQSVELSLRAKGIWAGPAGVVTSPRRLLVQLDRFRCRDPFSGTQRCVADAHLRMGIHLLPTASVVVGPGVAEPWDALVSALADRIAEQVAALRPEDSLETTGRDVPFVRSADGPWAEIVGQASGTLCTWDGERLRELCAKDVARQWKLRVPSRGIAGWTTKGDVPSAVLRPLGGTRYWLDPQEPVLRRLDSAHPWHTFARSGLDPAVCAEPRREAKEARQATVVTEARRSTVREHALPAAYAGSLDHLADPDADVTWDREELSRASVGPAVREVLVERTRRGKSMRLRVLVHMSPQSGSVTLDLFVNPPGASWTRGSFREIEEGVYEAIFTGRYGRTYVYATGSRDGSSPLPLLYSRRVALELD